MEYIKNTKLKIRKNYELIIIRVHIKEFKNE